MESRQDLTFARQLAFLLGADIMLGFIYSVTPESFDSLRKMIALIQLGFMAITMAATMRRVLQDY